MRHLRFLAVVLASAPLFAPGPLLAAKAEGSPPGARDRYQNCLAQVKEDAQTAYDEALAWRDTGGGAAAEHCSALALVQLKRYREAAQALDGLGAAGKLADASMRAELFDQAGNVWLLAAQPDSAERSFSNALALSSRDVDVYADRARARAMRKDWAGADADLSAALAKDNNRSDLLVLRASARHALGRKPEARADIDRALGLYPGYADALVERGAMKLETGDRAGAHADWQNVVAVSPNTPAGNSARRYLSQMDAPQPQPAAKP